MFSLPPPKTLPQRVDPLKHLALKVNKAYANQTHQTIAKKKLSRDTGRLSIAISPGLRQRSRQRHLSLSPSLKVDQLHTLKPAVWRFRFLILHTFQGWLHSSSETKKLADTFLAISLSQLQVTSISLKGICTHIYDKAFATSRAVNQEKEIKDIQFGRGGVNSLFQGHMIFIGNNKDYNKNVYNWWMISVKLHNTNSILKYCISIHWQWTRRKRH